MIEVKITRVDVETRTSREYQQVADTGNERDGGRVFAYVPCEKQERVERVLLHQQIDDGAFDLDDVIRAVNGL